MINTYYQNHKERLWKEARERYQNFSGEKNDKRWKMAEKKNIKILLKKKKNGVSIDSNVSRSYMSTEEIKD